MPNVESCYEVQGRTALALLAAGLATLGCSACSFTLIAITPTTDAMAGGVSVRNRPVPSWDMLPGQPGVWGPGAPSRYALLSFLLSACSAWRAWYDGRLEFLPASRYFPRCRLAPPIASP